MAHCENPFRRALWTPREKIFARLRDTEKLRQENCGAGCREIREMRENRAAFVRVFRVVRGEEA